MRQNYEGRIAPPGEGKIAVVVSKFNRTITQSLLDGCLAKLAQNSVRERDITVAWVPGAFELPTVAARFADDEEYQAVICLGCIIKGETPHDTYIAQAVSGELARLGVETQIPVIFGVLTCNTTEQALARAGLSPSESSAEGVSQCASESSRDKVEGGTVGNKGAEAAEAALEMLDLFIQLPEPTDAEPDDDSIRYQAERYRTGAFDADRLDDGDDDFEEAEDTSRPVTFRRSADRPGPKSPQKPSGPYKSKGSPKSHGSYGGGHGGGYGGGSGGGKGGKPFRGNSGRPSSSKGPSSFKGKKPGKSR